MKFFIIVSFVMANTMALDRPLFIFKQPVFDSVLECNQYVSVMHQRIYTQASASYNFKHQPDAIYCLPDDKVKEIFEYNYEDEKPKQNI
tara:strand:+ start:576 stop:842 length:267 start_codon:yes stop_codon:yes gene_type:complete